MKLLVTGGSGYLGTHVRRFFNADDLSRRAHLDVLNPDEAAMVAHYEVVILSPPSPVRTRRMLRTAFARTLKAR